MHFEESHLRLEIQELQTAAKKHIPRIEGNYLNMFRPAISMGKTGKKPPRTAANPTFDYEAEKEKLRTYHQNQNRRIKGHQDKAIHQAGPGASEESRLRQHKEQVHVVEEHQKHEMQVLENRAKRAQETAQKSGKQPGAGDKKKR